MSENLRELYQSVIVDHGRHPRNFGSLACPCLAGEGFNALCGDRIYLQLVVKNDAIENAQFCGEGCAISVASASLMTEVLRGKKVPEAKALFAEFHALVTGGVSSAQLGKLAVFAGVREFPARVKCATLAWHTLLSALAGEKNSISTENA